MKSLQCITIGVFLVGWIMILLPLLDVKYERKYHLLSIGTVLILVNFFFFYLVTMGVL